MESEKASREIWSDWKLSQKDKCSTGIREFDNMLLGGIPRRRTILVEGPPGAGKTIFSLHFIISGILNDPKYPERAIYVSLDENPQDLIDEALTFGWDLKKLIDLGQLVIIDAFSGRLGITPKFPYGVPIGKFNKDAVLSRIQEARDDIKATRLVVDPVTSLLDNHAETQKRRKAVLELAALLSRLKFTTILTSELHEDITAVERYAAQGLVRLGYSKSERTVTRTLQIVKMRKTMHSMDIIPFKITASGIELIT